MIRKLKMEEIMSGKKKQTKEDMLQLQMRSDDNFLTKQEELIRGKTLCRFPDRPVFRFIPARPIIHQLILEMATI